QKEEVKPEYRVPILVIEACQKWFDNQKQETWHSILHAQEDESKLEEMERKARKDPFHQPSLKEIQDDLLKVRTFIKAMREHREILEKNSSRCFEKGFYVYLPGIGVGNGAPLGPTTVSARLPEPSNFGKIEAKYKSQKC